MKKFLIRILLLGVLVVLCLPITFYLPGNKTDLPSAIVYEVMEEMKSPSTYEYAIFGDSVADSLFSTRTYGEQGYFGGTTVASTTVCGNYVLLRNYLNYHPETKQIYYILTPHSLMADFDFNLSYLYFILPLYHGNEDLFSEGVQNTLSDLYGTYALHPLFMKGIENHAFFRKCALEYMASVTSAISPSADTKQIIPDYTCYSLKQMNSLCQKCNVSFTVLSSPIADHDLNHDLNSLEDFIQEDPELSSILANYIDSIDYYENDVFSDGTHFNEGFLYPNRNQIIQDLYQY